MYRPLSPVLSTLMKSLHAPVYASRLRVLTGLIAPHLREGDKVLDVGCGVGTLAHTITSNPACPSGVVATGLERFPRGGEPIDVIAYDGGAFPFDDQSFDVVVIADVLHHEADPDALLGECARVARRLLIIKDHQVKGPFAHKRISLIDWAANAPHGVPCLYRYNTPAEWAEAVGRLPLEPREVHSRISLYPPGVDQLFGGSLQYLAVLERPGPGEAA